MKNLLLSLALVASAVSLQGQSHQLVKRWETGALLKTPESVLFDEGARVLYVSNIDGKKAWEKDGKGSIGKVGLDGTVQAVDWVTGLNAPKGMGLFAGRLYVADIDRVVVIDVAKAAVVATIEIEGAQRLNDIAIDSAGAVYVSDSRVGRVHKLVNDKPTLLLENLKNPNGLLVHGGNLYVLADGAFFKMEADRSLTKIVDGIEGRADGIVHVQGDEFIVTGWEGFIYYVDAAKGGKQQLQESKSKGIYTADIGYDAKNRVLYVPTFYSNTIAAYEVK